MTLETLQAYVGASSSRTETFRRSNGELTEWGWRDTMSGSDGWWWAVTHGERVLAIGWTGGDHLDRAAEIRRAIVRHMQPGASW